MLLISALFSLAQNLVRNPGFEEIDSCQQFLTSNPNYPRNLFYWYAAPINISPDLCSTCYSGNFAEQAVPNNYLGGYQYPNTGNNFVGIVSYFQYVDPTDPIKFSREYICSRLSSPLVVGHHYSISYYWSLANTSKIAMNKLGVYFAIDSITGEDDPTEGWVNLCMYTPQVVSEQIFADTQNWNLNQSIFIADDNYEHFCFGNFFPDEQVDTIHIVPFVLISGTSPHYAYSYQFIDDFSIVDLDAIGIEEGPFDGSKIYSENGYLYLDFPANTGQVLTLQLQDLQGKVLLQSQLQPDISYEVKLPDFNRGIYVLTLEREGKRYYTKISLN